MPPQPARPFPGSRGSLGVHAVSGGSWARRRPCPPQQRPVQAPARRPSLSQASFFSNPSKRANPRRPSEDEGADWFTAAWRTPIGARLGRSGPEAGVLNRQRSAPGGRWTRTSSRRTGCFQGERPTWSRPRLRAWGARRRRGSRWLSARGPRSGTSLGWRPLMCLGHLLLWGASGEAAAGGVLRGVPAPLCPPWSVAEGRSRTHVFFLSQVK